MGAPCLCKLEIKSSPLKQVFNVFFFVNQFYKAQLSSDNKTSKSLTSEIKTFINFFHCCSMAKVLSCIHSNWKSDNFISCRKVLTPLSLLLSKLSRHRTASSCTGESALDLLSICHSDTKRILNKIRWKLCELTQKTFVIIQFSYSVLPVSTTLEISQVFIKPLQNSFVMRSIFQN